MILHLVVLMSGVVVKAAPTGTKTLSRPESIEMETRPSPPSQTCSPPSIIIGAVSNSSLKTTLIFSAAASVCTS